MFALFAERIIQVHRSGNVQSASAARGLQMIAMKMITMQMMIAILRHGHRSLTVWLVGDYSSSLELRRLGELSLKLSLNACVCRCRESCFKSPLHETMRFVLIGT